MAAIWAETVNAQLSAETDLSEVSRLSMRLLASCESFKRRIEELEDECAQRKEWQTEFEARVEARDRELSEQNDRLEQRCNDLTRENDDLRQRCSDLTRSNDDHHRSLIDLRHQQRDANIGVRQSCDSKEDFSRIELSTVVESEDSPLPNFLHCREEKLSEEASRARMAMHQRTSDTSEYQPTGAALVHALVEAHKSLQHSRKTVLRPGAARYSEQAADSEIRPGVARNPKQASEHAAGMEKFRINTESPRRPVRTVGDVNLPQSNLLKDQLDEHVGLLQTRMKQQLDQRAEFLLTEHVELYAAALGVTHKDARP
jgi:hypothetical protein